MWNKLVRRRSQSGQSTVKEVRADRQVDELRSETEQLVPGSVGESGSVRWPANVESRAVAQQTSVAISSKQLASAGTSSWSREVAEASNKAHCHDQDDLRSGSATSAEACTAVLEVTTSTTCLVASPIMCAYAFSVLERELQSRSRRPSVANPFAGALPPDSEDYGLFITWKIHTANWQPGAPTDPGWQLRGCIGTLTPTGLHDALRSYAITAALHDRRFSPVSIGELPRLQCGVSLLSDFAERESVWDWTPGLDGLIVEIEPLRNETRWKGSGRPRASRFSATYLPEVPLELKWSKFEAISSLIRKSGYSGEIPTDESDPWWSECVSLTTYRSSKAELRYDEYRAMLVQTWN